MKHCPTFAYARYLLAYLVAGKQADISVRLGRWFATYYKVLYVQVKLGKPGVEVSRGKLWRGEPVFLHPQSHSENANADHAEGKLSHVKRLQGTCRSYL